jgi:hypothetical protein
MFSEVHMGIELKLFGLLIMSVVGQSTYVSHLRIQRNRLHPQ